MRFIFTLSFLFLPLLSCNHMAKKKPTIPDAKSVSLTPPQAQKIPYEMKKMGDTRVDPYYWMKERDTAPVLNYIKAENTYYEKNLKPAASLTEDIFREMKARIKDDDMSAPYKKGDYYYYSRVEKGQEYPIYCRKHKTLKAKEQVILDINILAKGKKYYSAHLVGISPNQEMLAYAVDDVGRRFYTIHFKNLVSGKMHKENIPDTTGDWAWTNDNKTGFFAKQDPKTLRSDRIFRYSIGDKAPTEVYFEKDEIFDVGVGRSLNGQTIFIASHSFDSIEYRYISADKPNDAFKLFLKREKNHEYSVDDGGDGFYIRTNWKAKNFKLMKTAYNKTAKAHWKDVIPHRQKVYLEDFAIFKNFLATEVRKDGLIHIEVMNRNGNKPKHIEFPDPAYVAGLTSNPEYDTATLRYTYNSLVNPTSIYDYDVASGKSTLVKRQEVPTYNSELYKMERVWAKASDGTKVPVSLVYRKDKFVKGQNPLFIYGYGSYGISMDAGFRSSVVSMTDRGFVFAIAHIRGGQELGRDWYEKGRMMHKKNTFTDFIACTEYLLKQGFGKKGHVYMEGGSAGGLLMGAVMNLRPDLYRGVHAAVPFVDVLTTMLDPSIPLTTAEYEQWGNPNEKKAYNYIKSYSPYDNVTDKKYPYVLVTTGYHDSQVQYWEPLKWVAKLRDHNKADTKIFIRTELSAGHGGLSGRFARTREVAQDYAFFLWVEGLSQ
jgi:oligopeptidase B